LGRKKENIARCDPKIKPSQIGYQCSNSRDTEAQSHPNLIAGELLRQPQSNAAEYQLQEMSNDRECDEYGIEADQASPAHWVAQPPPGCQDRNYEEQDRYQKTRSSTPKIPQ